MNDSPLLFFQVAPPDSCLSPELAGGDTCHSRQDDPP
jgi:hypothetical protein